MNKCRYAAIKDFDMNQADGISVSLWMQGCEHRCEGCYNKDTWDFDGGTEFTQDTINTIKDLLNKDEIHKDLSVLGGETLSPNKLDMLQELFQQVKDMNKNIKIWVWTGYTLEEIKDLEILKYIDVLIDGKYEESLRDISRYYGSSNQTIHYL